MTAAERELARQRDRLLHQERARVERILAVYAHVQVRLEHDLQALADQITEATARGIEVRPGWLFAQSRYRSLISDLTARTHDFLSTAAHLTIDGQKTAVQDAVQDGRRLAQAALHGPRPLVAQVTGTWDRLPGPALDHLIGRAGDGSPLARLFGEIAPAAPERVRDTLAYGVAAGKNPRVIAREAALAANVTPNRALTIARTEIVRSHREAVTDTWKQTNVVTGWVWRSARDQRTCPVCWALDGTEHPADEVQASHPCCRCGKVPRVKTWAQLGFPGVPETRTVTSTGPGVFASLPEADRLAILGRSKLDAYNNGEITLADLVAHTHSDRWGPGVRVASLAEAMT